MSVADAAAVNACWRNAGLDQPAASGSRWCDGIGDSTFDLAGVADPHEAGRRGHGDCARRSGVAENGAVWFTDRQIHQRAILFIAQHLALVVPREANREQHARSLQPASFVGPGFGVFISGPSKTADIEQSLVIGAHGPRLADGVSGWTCLTLMRRLGGVAVHPTISRGYRILADSLIRPLRVSATSAVSSSTAKENRTAENAETCRGR